MRKMNLAKEKEISFSLFQGEKTVLTYVSWFKSAPKSTQLEEHSPSV